MDKVIVVTYDRLTTNMSNFDRSNLPVKITIKILLKY